MARPAGDWRFGPLESRHVREGFTCGQPQVDEYLRLYAGQNARRNLGRTFVATAGDGVEVLGYYTLVCGSVRFEQVPEKLPRYPIPVVKLARLGVDQRVRGRGIGSLLLMDALARVERIAGDVAVFAVEVDAMDEKARGFYLKYHFRELSDDRLHLYLPIKELARCGLND